MMKTSQQRDPEGWALGQQLAGRYRLAELLGQGGFGTVYKAFDARTQAHVALKRLRVRNPEALLAFKQEFRSLARITHRNLASLFELHAEGDDWFFTMELIDGQSLLEHLHVPRSPRSGLALASSSNEEPTASMVSPASPVLSSDETGTLHQPVAFATPPAFREEPAPLLPRRPCPIRDFDELRRVLGELAETLAWVHQTGKLHRDIKPQNVRVASNGRVVLLDFGLVHEFGARFVPLEGQPVVVGSPAYMAPEVMVGQRATPASDWYSFGVLLHETLTGVRPFGVSSGSQLLHAKMTVDPLGPSELADGVPADLDALCRALLSRKPEQRPDARAIRSALGARHARPAVPGPRERTFVGRSAELAGLRQGLARAAGGMCTVALVGGLSGMGKSTLVEHFLSELGPEAWVLAGRCYEYESVPYKALDGLVDALARRLATLSPVELTELVPPAMGALARVFPALSKLVGPSQSPTATPAEERLLLREAARALSELLGAIARRHPVVLVIDDLQWGDEDSLALLGGLMRGAPPILLVGMYRSDEVGTSPFLQRLFAPQGVLSLAQRVVRIPIGPLDEAEARALAEALGPAVDAGAVAREAGGCPLLIDELTRHALAGEEASERRLTMDDAIRARVAQLPEAARCYLEVVAVAGQPLPAAVLRAAAGLQIMGPKDRQHLENGNLVRSRATAAGEEVEPWHDRVREAVVAGLGEDRRRVHHLSLAEVIEATPSPDPALLADHFLQGGASARAQPYAVAAGDHAAGALAFDRAARYYRTALELTDTPRRDLHVRLAQALRNAGRGPQAARAYLEAARLAEADEALALRVQATEQFLFSGEYEAGEAVIRDVLARAGVSPARNGFSSFGSFLLGELRLRSRGLGFTARPTEEVDPEVLQRLDILWSASIGYSMSNIFLAQAIQKRHLLLALDKGDVRRTLRALTVERAFSGVPGGKDERWSNELGRSATELMPGLDWPQGRGLGLLADGAGHWLHGRWPELYRSATSATAQLQECTGVTWERDTSLFLTLEALAQLGSWRECRTRLPGLIADAAERGDLYLETQLRTRLSWLSRLMDGEPVRAREDVDAALGRWTAKGFQVVHFWGMLGRASSYVYEGDGEAALAVLHEQRWPLRLSMLLLGQYYRATMTELRARAWLVKARGAPAGSRARRHALEQAERDGKRLLREDMPWTLPHGNSVLGCVAAARGDRRQAHERWEQAARGFDAVSMAVHAAAVRLRLGEVEQAETLLRAEEIREPARMAAMLCPGGEG
jgi:serine/threonine protein kinase/tetratricopeptide (TPR) repeat protein